ncbi:flagellar hook-associated protein 2 [Alkalicoccus daliensis]|nr:flagellar hook-associated protein 2 [Alkalicoccus daliensis]
MNRMTGFASGMDINQMVSDLMRAERQPLEPMQQNSMELQLKIDEYRQMNLKFSEFRNNTFDGILRSSNMRSRETVSSNEAAVTARASASTPEGSYTISDASLARAEMHVSEAAGENGSFVNDLAAFDRSESFLQQAELLHGVEEGQTEAAFAIAVFDENGAAVPQEFTVDESSSLDDILNDVNQSALGVQAFYDEFSGRISLQRAETGVFNETGNEIQFGEIDADGEFIEAEPGEQHFFSTAFGLENNTPMQEAANAAFTMNGLSEMERRSNSFEINGLNVTLNQPFTEQVSIGVSSDDEKIFDTVMGFVEDYNELVSAMQEKTGEEYFRDYAPLTDEQRRELSDTEVEMWEEKSNSGLLRRDSIISGAVSSMRSQFYEPVNTADGDQAFTQITEIGITTSTDFRQGGILEVNEEQLRASIAEDPDAVFNLFAADGETQEERGIARRLRATLDDSIQQIGQRAGRTEMSGNQTFTLGRELEQQSDQISNFERRMQQVEQRYWSQFNAMEQAMARANAQAEQLMSQMGGKQGM